MAELNRSVTLLACQIDVPAITTAAERNAHTDRVAAAIDAELTAGWPVDLVDLPELGTLDHARSCFNPIDAKKSAYLARAIEHELLNIHGNTHKRLPRLLKKALRDRVVEGMRRKIAYIVAELVAGFPADSPVDLCGTFANPLPARVLGPVLGIAYEQAEGLKE